MLSEASSFRSLSPCWTPASLRRPLELEAGFGWTAAGRECTYTARTGIFAGPAVYAHVELEAPSVRSGAGNPCLERSRCKPSSLKL